ncbi:MAG: hypothetical protein U0795_06745 [Pirellulales bacterium]
MTSRRVPQARDTRSGSPEPRRLVVEPLETRALMAVLWGEWSGPRAEHADRLASREADRSSSFDNKFTAGSHSGDADTFVGRAVMPNLGIRNHDSDRSTANRSVSTQGYDRQTFDQYRSSVAPAQRSNSLIIVPVNALVSVRPASGATFVTKPAPQQISLIAVPITTVSSTAPTTSNLVQSARNSTPPATQTSRPVQNRSSTSLLTSGSSSNQRTSAPVSSIQIVVRPVSFVSSAGTNGNHSSNPAASRAAGHFDWLSGAASGVSWLSGTHDVPLTDGPSDASSATSDVATTTARSTVSNQFGGVVAWSTTPDFGRPWRKKNGVAGAEGMAGDTLSAGSDSSATDRPDVSYLGLIELPFSDPIEAQQTESRDAEPQGAASESHTRRMIGDLELPIDPAKDGRDARDGFVTDEDSAERSWDAVPELKGSGEQTAVESSDRAELADAAFVPSPEHDQWGGLVAIGVDVGTQRSQGRRQGRNAHDRADVASLGANGSVGYGWSGVVVELDSIMSNAQSFQLVDNAAVADPSFDATSFATSSSSSTNASHAAAPTHAPAVTSPAQPAPRTE